MAECPPMEKPKPKPKPRTVTSNKVSHEENNVHMNKQIHETETVEAANLIEALITHNKKLDESLTKCDAEIDERKKVLDEIQKELDELEATSRGYDDEISALSSSNSKNQSIVDEVENQLAIYERLKSDEKLFKASCNDELERLQKELELLNTDFSDATKADLAAQLERNEARLEAGRIELATINRKVASIRRQIDQVPNRMELREYRLRFSELYNQVSATHRSTKQFFSLYNSLEDTKRYLEKELSLLNSIVDSYQLACNTASGREEFLRQLQTINDGMRETCSKVDKRYQMDKFSVETLQAEIQRLLDVKVAYEKCLLELEVECRKNETLLAECKAIDGDGDVKSKMPSQGSSSGESDND